MYAQSLNALNAAQNVNYQGLAQNSAAMLNKADTISDELSRLEEILADIQMTAGNVSNALVGERHNCGSSTEAPCPMDIRSRLERLIATATLIRVELNRSASAL